MSTFEEDRTALHAHATRLVRLLEDPHEGLSTWHLAVRYEILKIGKFAGLEEPAQVTVP